jgi:UDP:flavonoid glycosyltransferase YjiC (YdhE family)
MYSILLTGPPFYGHVTPMLTLAEGLVERGHQVRYMTGSRFRDAVSRTGATYVSLPEGSDFDDRELAQRDGPRVSGLKEIRQDVISTCIVPAVSQYEAIQEQHAACPVDIVVADPTFYGAALLAGHDPARRPLVIGAGILALMLSSRHVAPFGMGLPPWKGPLNVPRNILLNALVQRVALRPVQTAYTQVYESVHGRRPPGFAFDWYATTDAVVQLTVPSFEYPRPDAPVDIHFAGPANRRAARRGPLPEWWDDLRTDKPVVVVTQGTFTNTDWGELVRPALDALAGEDVLVVVTTGGPPVASLGPLPPNVRAAEFVPYDELFPLTDVLVTNGGYGGIHFAMAHGVPVVTAGDTEDKPEACARVAWSGVGVNLRTGQPSAAAINRAVMRVLASPQHRVAARRLAAEIADSRGVDELVSVIQALHSSRQAVRVAARDDSGGQS